MLSTGVTCSFVPLVCIARVLPHLLFYWQCSIMRCSACFFLSPLPISFCCSVLGLSSWHSTLFICAKLLAWRRSLLSLRVHNPVRKAIHIKRVRLFSAPGSMYRAGKKKKRWGQQCDETVMCGTVIWVYDDRDPDATGPHVMETALPGSDVQNATSCWTGAFVCKPCSRGRFSVPMQTMFSAKLWPAAVWLARFESGDRPPGSAP